jgi:hypothetical protein
VPDDADSGRTPIEDGWEPQQPRRGPIHRFREHPARFFGALGTILFIGGWGAAIYLAVSESEFGTQPTAFRLQLLVSVGSSVTLASGVLWGIAVYIWLHLLPEAPTSLSARSADEDRPIRG